MLCTATFFFLFTAATRGGCRERGVAAMAQKSDKSHFQEKQTLPEVMCSRPCLAARTQRELAVSGSDNTRENVPISSFSKVVSEMKKKKKKPKQSSISTWGPLMYHERLRLLSLHLIRCLYSSRVRKPVMGKLQKGETGRAPGPSEVLSKAFPFYALSRRYSSCQLIFILAKTWGLKRTFQLLRHTLQQD